jgi:hypothetical protein
LGRRLAGMKRGKRWREEGKVEIEENCRKVNVEN